MADSSVQPVSRLRLQPAPPAPREGLWELLFRSTNRGIAVADPRTRRFVAVNPAFATMHASTPDACVGLPVRAVLAPGQAERLDRLHADVASADRVAFEADLIRSDGSRFPAAVEVVAARAADGAQSHWLCWVEDLTERRRVEGNAAGRAGELARSNADLDRFAAVVSHDLQSPLRVIGGCARVLERRVAGQLGDEERELVDHLVGGVQRMVSLLDGIREYSQVRAEDSVAGRVDCAAAVAEALEALAADLDAADADVSVGPLPTVPGNAVALTQLFQNLIANAIKFRREGTRPHIAIRAERRGEHWCLTVADDGIGIAPDHASRVFEFGQRLHTDADYAGTGIGLAVCKTVVERHGGTIWVEPAPEGGSAFRFTLPARPAGPRQPSR